MPIMSAVLRMEKKGGQEFETRLPYIRPCLKTKVKAE